MSSKSLGSEGPLGIIIPLKAHRDGSRDLTRGCERRSQPRLQRL